VAAAGWEHIPKIITETETQYWAHAASVPRQLAMASGKSVSYQVETKIEM
jgi:sucrose-6-phosphate hydrolase SacC (GH32 family)